MPDFDPKAYAEAANAEEVPAFDPATYATEANSTPPPRVGGFETFANSGANALPLGKQLVDALSTAALAALRPGHGARLTPAARAEAQRLGVDLPEEASTPGPLDTYRALRDEREARTAAGEAQNRGTALLGKGVGIGASIFAPWLPKVTVGSGVAGRIASNALTGGAYGVVNGVANGRADLTRGELGQALLDAIGTEGLKRAYADAKAGHYGRAALDTMGAGGIGGFLTGGLLGTALEAGRAALSPFSGAARNAAISAGRKVLTNGADSLSTRAELPEHVVETAIREGAIVPGGTNAGAFERLDPLVDKAAEKYRDIVAALEAKGAPGPQAQSVADHLLGRAASLERNTMIDQIPQEYLDTAMKVLGKADPATGRLGLSQGEQLKSSLYKLAKYGRVGPEPVLAPTRRDIASIFKNANEQAIDRWAEGAGDQAQQVADEFVPAKQKLGALLEAQGAARRGYARGAQRSHFGPMEIAAGLSEVAAGHPMTAVPATLGMKLLRGRGPSTTAAYGLRLSDALAPTAANNAGTLGKGAALLQALKDRGVPVIDIPTPMMAQGDAQ